MPLPRDIAGKESRNPELVNTGMYTAGDYIVPQYAPTGRKEAAGQVLGDTKDLIGLAQRIAQHAKMGGAELLPPMPVAANPSVAAKKKSRKPTPQHASSAPIVVGESVTPVLRVDGLAEDLSKAAGEGTPPVVNTILQPYPPTPLRAQEDVLPPPIEVVFSTQLGKIRLNAVAVLDSNSALALVFANEGEVRYEPAPGTNVQLIINGKEEHTMYPGFKFTWVDQKKVIMVFVKLEDE